MLLDDDEQALVGAVLFPEPAYRAVSTPPPASSAPLYSMIASRLSLSSATKSGELAARGWQPERLRVLGDVAQPEPHRRQAVDRLGALKFLAVNRAIEGRQVFGA
ncbi:MAG: hypothetical protein ABI150_02360 [Nitrobacter sp.]